MSNLAFEMRQSIAHYISNLLYLHDCVIIPGFGGFVGNKKSAYIHPISAIIYPPSKVILFNKNLTQNDGLLATHIAKEEGKDLSEVTNLIEAFVKTAQNELAERNAFKLEKIGVFSRGKEGNISFTQNKNYNYNLASFGMKANHKSKKVERNITLNEQIRLGVIINNLLNREYMSRPADMKMPRTYAVQLGIKI